jgi:hypothetical protein
LKDGDIISELEDGRQDGEAGIEDDDEPAEFTDAMKMMANISPSDLNNAELE